MFDLNPTMKMARSMTAHAARRQTELAKNVANADTPGYKAHDFAPISIDEVRSSGTSLKRTRTDHLAGRPLWASDRARLDPNAPASPNGNTVTLEREMARQADIYHQHEISLSVYRAGLNIMRTAIGRRS